MITNIESDGNGLFLVYNDGVPMGKVSPEVIPMLFGNTITKPSTVEHQNTVDNINHMEKLNKAIDKYLTVVRGRNASEDTLSSYSKKLRYFCDYFSDKYNGNPKSEPTYYDIVDYRDYLTSIGLKSSSICTYLTILHSFFEWSSQKILGADRYVNENPVDKSIFPRDKQSESRAMSFHFLNAQDVENMWANTMPKDKGTSKRNWVRNYAITTLLLDGKIRNDELLNVRLSDIDFENKTLFIRNGKGGKSRVVALTDISLSAINLYLKSDIRPSDCSEEDFLFGTTSESRFQGKISGFDWHKGSNAWLSALVERQVKAVTGKSGFRTHSLRHTGAVMDLRNGTTLERLKEELGHSSITTTEIYAPSIGTLRDCEDARKAYEERDKWAVINEYTLSQIKSAK